MIKLEDLEKNLTHEEITQFENETNLKLPESFKEHILKYNGGYPVNDLYFKGYPIDEFIPIKYGNYHIKKRLSNLDGFLNKSSIPFSTSNGGVIFIDSLNQEKVSIKYPDGQTDFLTNSFSEFLNGLKNQPYDF